MMKKAFFILFLGSHLSAFAQVAAPAVELNESNIEQVLAQREETQSKETKPVETIVAAEKKETEIPLQLESKKGSSAESGPLAKLLLGSCVITGLILAGWLMIRRYRVSNRRSNPATQMKILAQHHLGPKKSLAVIRVAGESMLIGVTDHHISLIKSLSLLDEDLPEESPQDFAPVMQKSIQRGATSNMAPTEESDEFAMTGLKDFVSSKMKNLRSFQ